MSKKITMNTPTFLLITLLVLSASRILASDLPDPDGKPADMSKPVQVFILLGQSNMLGFGKINGGEGSLDNAVKNKGLYSYLQDDSGAWTVRNDVRNVRVMCSGSGPWKTYLNEWMTIGGGNIGPEIGIGHYVGELLDAPVLILKSCIGNRSLGYDLLPPSAPGYEGNKDDPERTPIPGPWYAGVQYDGDTKAAKDVLKDLQTYYPDAKDYEVAGFFFWQGAKDLGKGGSADKYEENLIHLIQDLRADFNAPNAPFVCATMGQAKKGGSDAGGIITDAQLAIDGENGKYPDFKGNVATFYSNPVSKGGSANGHYGGNAETYMNVGEGMGKLMANLLETSGIGKHAPSLTHRATPSRLARKLSPDKALLLHRSLIAELKNLETMGKLKPMYVQISGARSKAALVGIPSKDTLAFRSESGRTANIPADKLKPSDMATLAQVAARLSPENQTIQALLGVYYEGFGRVAEADKRYAAAGPEARKEMDVYFE